MDVERKKENIYHKYFSQVKEREEKNEKEIAEELQRTNCQVNFRAVVCGRDVCDPPVT